MGDEIITGKIYALKSSQTDKIYIGSTTRKLKTRFNEHCSHHKRFLNNQEKYKTTSENILRYDDCYIELIKEVCCSKRQLLILEGDEILLNKNCVNKVISGNMAKFETKTLYAKDYYENHKEQILEHSSQNKDVKKLYNANYFQEHKNAIQQRNKENTKKNNINIICECGASIKIYGKVKHIKSIKHIKGINKI